MSSVHSVLLTLISIAYTLNAQTMGNLTCGDSINHFLEAGATNTYTVTVAEDSYVAISSCGSSFDTLLELKDNSGATLYEDDDSAECGYDGILTTDDVLSSGSEYTFEISGYDVNAYSFGGYDLQVFCNTSSVPSIPIVEGDVVDRECNFHDFGGGFITPMTECYHTKLNEKYVCNENGDGLTIQQYYNFDVNCEEECVDSAEFVSYHKYEYNCAADHGYGCNWASAAISFGCDTDDITIQYQFITDTCSLANTVAECSGTNRDDGYLRLVYYTDDACTDIDYTINVQNFTHAGTCAEWICHSAGDTVTTSTPEECGVTTGTPEDKGIGYIIHDIVVIIGIIFLFYQ